MIELLKKDPALRKVHGLQDFRHKLENLIDHNIPQWVQGLLDVCKSICSLINDHPKVKVAIEQFVSIADGYRFVMIPTTCETRFAEYLHLHLDAILKNIKVLLMAIAMTFLKRRKNMF